VSGAAATAPRRPARWPWFVVGGFILTAIGASFIVVANEGSILEQVPFIIAFALFGVVGALIVSREPGNRIGGLLLYGSGATAASFVAGELTTDSASGSSASSRTPGGSWASSPS
jgi:hypothetical protein